MQLRFRDEHFQVPNSTTRRFETMSALDDLLLNAAHLGSLDSDAGAIGHSHIDVLVHALGDASSLEVVSVTFEIRVLRATNYESDNTNNLNSNGHI